LYAIFDVQFQTHVQLLLNQSQNWKRKWNQTIPLKIMRKMVLLVRIVMVRIWMVRDLKDEDVEDSTRGTAVRTVAAKARMDPLKPRGAWKLWRESGMETDVISESGMRMDSRKKMTFSKCWGIVILWTQELILSWKWIYRSCLPMKYFDTHSRSK
jgi:hypothetical protein